MNRPAPNPTLRRLGFSLALVAALLSVSLGVLVLSWKRDITRELEAIEASGAPQAPSSVATPSGGGPPWWAGDEIDDPVADLGILDPVALAALLQRPDPDLAPFSRPLLEDLAALYEREAEAGWSVDDLWLEALEARGLLSMRNGWARPSEERLLIAQVEHAAAGQLLERVERACSGFPFDGRAWLDDWLASDAPFPVPLPVMGPLGAQRAVGRSATLAALDGDLDEALAALRLGFCAARAYEQAPGLLHGLTWMLQVDLATNALLAVAALMPEADLTEFEGELAALDPQGRLSRALAEERALGLRVFEAGYRPGGLDWWTSPFRSLGLWLFESNDERVFLKTYREALDASRASSFSGRSALLETMQGLEVESLALRAQLMFPAVGSAFDSAAGVHATSTLAAAVLLGRREGAEAARAWLDDRRDPFSGEPYRTEVGAKGEVRAWSVGPDARSGPVEGRSVDEADDLVVLIPGR